MRRKRISLLDILGVEPSPRSVDYVKNKTQYQLHRLLTEQRHHLTWNLSTVIKKDVVQGLRQLLAVDNDITHKLEAIAQEEEQVAILEQAAEAIVRAIRNGHKIFFYGCGSTGRLAKFMESTLWRPFWRGMKRHRLWKKVRPFLPPDIEERLIGEMTGGDRALVSALEGLEDLKLVGRLQVLDRKVEKGDVVFCVTEGGETSSVIGAMEAAAEMWEGGPSNLEEARRHLYFVYNNPDSLLLPFDRSRFILTHPAITKINLTTGPQAITGSTRMQATTAETYVLGLILERAIHLLLSSCLQPEEMAEIGFEAEEDIKTGLESFAALPTALLPRVEDIAAFTTLEARVYQRKRRTTYFAQKALLTVFIDGAERSPTFHLRPLDMVIEKRRLCWFQVWTEARDKGEAWRRLLGRKFRGLDSYFYEEPFKNEIHDPYLREAALRSLAKASYLAQELFDFSFSGENLERRKPKRDDLAVVVSLDEEMPELKKKDSSWQRFIRLGQEAGACLALISSGTMPEEKFSVVSEALRLQPGKDVAVHVPHPGSSDPLRLRHHLLLKMLLNAHSTGVMAILGRVVGNTMTAVNPSNLKLIGRATHLIMSHVNDTLKTPEWKRRYGPTRPITYAEANAILFDAMDFLPFRGSETGEVELAIIRALEALRLRRYISWERAREIARRPGLEAYLCRLNPRLRSLPPVS